MSDKAVFDQVDFVVSDMEASVAFYRRLGLDIADDSTPWAGHHREAKGGPASVELDSRRSLAIWGPGVSAPAVFGFKLPTRDAVDAMWADLTGAGYEGALEPYDAYWGSRYAIVVDPDGNHVGLMSPPEDDKRRTWPDP